MKSLGNIIQNSSGTLTLSNGTSFVTITAPPTGIYILSFPPNLGASGQVLTTNGAGATYWSTVSGSSGLSSVGLTPLNPFLVVTGSPLIENGAISIDIGTLPIAKGGTGLTAAGSANQVLTSNGSGGVSWQTPGGLSSVGLTSSNPFLVVTGSPLIANGAISIDIGTLPIAKGGTGLTAAGSANQVLTSNGSGGVSWQTPGGLSSVGLTPLNPFLVVTGSPLTANGAISIDIGTLPISKGGTGLTTSGSANQVLTSNGSGGVSWQTPVAGGITSIGLTTPNFLAVTNSPLTANGALNIQYSGLALPIANGGTGQTLPGASGQVLTSNGAGGTTWTTLSSQYITSVNSAQLLVTSGLLSFSLAFASDFTAAQVATGLNTVAIFTPITGLNAVVGGLSTSVTGLSVTSLIYGAQIADINGRTTTLTVPSFLTVTGSPATGGAGVFEIAYSATTPLPAVNGGTGSNSPATGTGGVVLSTSPILITPTLGVATATSLVVSELAPSSAVATDINDKLISVPNTGTGNNVLSESPTFTGTISAQSIALSTPLSVTSG